VADKSKADTKVTRIKASDDRSTKATARVKAAKPAEVVSKKTNKPAKVVKTENKPVEARKNVFARIGGYFKGAWVELKQVRWPTRKATWSLTLAVLLFSAFFVVLILLLDTLFQFVFQQIIA